MFFETQTPFCNVYRTLELYNCFCVFYLSRLTFLWSVCVFIIHILKPWPAQTVGAQIP